MMGSLGGLRIGLKQVLGVREARRSLEPNYEVSVNYTQEWTLDCDTCTEWCKEISLLGTYSSSLPKMISRLLRHWKQPLKEVSTALESLESKDYDQVKLAAGFYIVFIGP